MSSRFSCVLQQSEYLHVHKHLQCFIHSGEGLLSRQTWQQGEHDLHRWTEKEHLETEWNCVLHFAPSLQRESSLARELMCTPLYSSGSGSCYQEYAAELLGEDRRHGTHGESCNQPQTSRFALAQDTSTKRPSCRSIVQLGDFHVAREEAASVLQLPGRHGRTLRVPQIVCLRSGHRGAVAA